MTDTKSDNNSIADDTYLYSGSFAEIVSHPSDLTFSFFERWFCGENSLGKAMRLLELPVLDIALPILVKKEEQMYVDLKAEEKTLYAHTIFSYRKQQNPHETPHLSVQFSKVINPFNWFDTLRILFKQSQWIAKPDNVIAEAKKYVEAIPEKIDTQNLNELESILKNQVWPHVLAVGILTEFFNQFLLHEAGAQYSDLAQIIASKTAPRDWFFLSISDQQLVKNGRLTFEDYLHKYGIRSDRDYELTAPRWYEIPDQIRQRIEELQDAIQPKISDAYIKDITIEKLKKYCDVAVELQIQRVEAKRKTLSIIDAFRQKLIQQLCENNCNHAQPDCVLIQKTIADTPITKGGDHTDKKQMSGKGFGVSIGTVSGNVLKVGSPNTKINSQTIAIFPNASPEFSTLYASCAGMIFLQGGQTSHGAAVAREYGIPALIDPKAEALTNGLSISINGQTGEWSTEADLLKNPSKISSHSKNTVSENQGEVHQENRKNILPFDEITRTFLFLVGGKAASLGQMKQWGFPVPDGFVVTVDAFEKMEQNVLPEDLQSHILKEFEKLGSKTVAVRSSAIGEDTLSTSFAGQFESVMAVSKEKLLKTILRCKDSAKTSRVQHYAQQFGVSKDQLKIAVIVQQMIESDVSGVIFTKNPITNDSSEMIIEAGFGLGESLVQGTILPTRFVIDKKTKQIKSTTPLNQDKMMVVTEGQIIEQPLSGSQQSTSLLSKEDLINLTTLALQLEEHFKTPQDIEWAIADGKLYILQSRSITT